MATRFLLQQDRHPDTKHNIEGPVRDKEIVTGLLGNVHEEARGKSGEFRWCNSSEVKLQILLLPLFRTSFYRHSYRSLSLLVTKPASEPWIQPRITLLSWTSLDIWISIFPLNYVYDHYAIWSPLGSCFDVDFCCNLIRETYSLFDNFIRSLFNLANFHRAETSNSSINCINLR